jgi:membrane-associated phospholipid phosphatase
MLFNMQGYPRWLDRFMWLATQLGNMLAAFVAAFLLFILNYHRLAIEIIFGTLTLWLLVEIIKALIDRDRPFLTLEKIRIIGWQEIGHSFPSGHTSQIFFLTTLFAQHFQLGIGGTAALYTLAALVGSTRIYVGAHYPRDVFAGMVLGSVWGLLATLVDPYWHILGF